MNLCITVSAVFIEILRVKGYLLKVSVISRYLFLNLKKAAVRHAKGLLLHPLGSLVEYAG